MYSLNGEDRKEEEIMVEGCVKQEDKGRRVKMRG